jgi:nicotinic acid mononucleotide adenylyltransferase
MEKKIEINKSKTPPKASSAGFSTSKKQLDKIEINPTVPSPVSEQAGNAVVLTFGRFNPPTSGHQKLVEAVKKIASSKRAKPLVYLSHTQDSKKNPLSYKDKMKYAREAFGDLMHVSKAKTIIEALKELENTYKNITVVVGSDRVNEFNTLLNKYNGKEYNFDSIVVESAGERDPDAEGVSGMSASKMRQAVQENDMKTFKSGLPSKLKSVAKEMFNVLKVEMNIREEMEKELEAEGLLNEAVLNLQQRIKRKILMRKYKTKLLRAKEIAKRRMAGTPKLKVRAQRMARDVARKKFAGQRGAKYHELSPSDKIAVDKLIDKKGALIKRIASRLLPVVRRKEVQRLQSFRLGQAMKPQHSQVKENVEVNEDNIMEMVSFKEMSQQVKRRGRPAKPETLAKRAAVAKAKSKEDGEEDYGPDNGREPDQNLIIQLQKSISMHGKKDVTFDQGSAVMIKPDQARKALDHYFGLKKPADKLAFIKNASANYVNFKKMIGEEKDNTDELLTIIENVMDRIEMSEISEEAADGLKKKAEKSKIPLGILRQVYRRGVAAWNSGHRPGTTPQQWAFARVNSFITKGKGTWGGADSDLAAKVRKESIEEAGLWANIHAKRERIKSGSGERMRKPGSKGAPSKDAIKSAQESASEKAYQAHQALRKKSGLPHPDYYKELGKSYDIKNDQERLAHQSNLKKKYGVKEEVELTEADSRIEKSGYHKGLSSSTAKARVAHWKKMDKLSDRDPRAYEPAPGDATAKTKESKHTKKYREMYGEQVVNEDAASHLRASAAMAKAGKHVAAAIHKKIAGALQRGDNTTAQGFKRQLQKAKAQKANESLNEQIEWNVVDYSHMKPEAAPTVSEMKHFMRAQGGFEHHPEVKKLMSFKEMKEIKAAGLVAKDGKTSVRDRMENDPEDQVFVGSYRSKHFEASPQAQKLYMNLPKGTDPNTASMATIEQDHLFQIFKKVVASRFATPEDVQMAKHYAARAMKFAADMNLERQHSYIIDMLRKINDASISDLDRMPPSDHLPDDPRFQSLPKNLNQEPGPGNDKDIDNMKNYLISRNIKAQRKLKIIDAD